MAGSRTANDTEAAAQVNGQRADRNFSRLQPAPAAAPAPAPAAPNILDWLFGPQSIIGQIGNGLFGPQSPIGQAGSALGKLGQIGSGIIDQSVKDASGQSLPTQITEPADLSELKRTLASSGLSPEIQADVLNKVNAGWLRTPEEAMDYISAARLNADSQRVAGEGLQDLTRLESDYLGPTGYFDTNINRLSTLARDPMAIKTDGDYAPYLEQIARETLAAEDQARREGAQRAASRGVGAKGAPTAQLAAARSGGMQARSSALSTAQSDAQRRLQDLETGRGDFRSNLISLKDTAKRGMITNPYDWQNLDENHTGVDVYNQGAARELLDRILGDVNTKLGIGANLGSTVANSIKIPGLK